MSTTASIFYVMGIIGFITFMFGVVTVLKSKGKGERKDWAEWAIGQILILPTATMSVIEEGTTKNWILFFAVLMVGIVAVCNLGKKDKKEK